MADGDEGEGQRCNESEREAENSEIKVSCDLG